MKRERPSEPFRQTLTRRAQSMRREPSLAERKLWSYLRNDQFMGLRFRRQFRIGVYVADFYCAKVKLVVELDGDSHSDQVEYDNDRTDFLNGHGIHVIRFTNFDVIENIEGVLDALGGCCASRLPPLPSPLPEYGERE
jgi:very-short-patch-repair endonuclease